MWNLPMQKTECKCALWLFFGGFLTCLFVCFFLVWFYIPPSLRLRHTLLWSEPWRKHKNLLWASRGLSSLQTPLEKTEISSVLSAHKYWEQVPSVPCLSRSGQRQHQHNFSFFNLMYFLPSSHMGNVARSPQRTGSPQPAPLWRITLL